MTGTALYLFKGKPLDAQCASEAEVYGYTRYPAQIVDVDGAFVDLAKTLGDWRNWPGIKGQKYQALVREVLDQCNAVGPKGSRHQRGYGVISFGQVAANTGIQPRTAQTYLEDLARRGIVDLDVTAPATKRAVWRAGLRLPVADWGLAHVHGWAGPQGPF